MVIFLIEALLIVSVIWFLKAGHNVSRAQGLTGRVTGTACGSPTKEKNCYKVFVVVKSSDGKTEIAKQTAAADGQYKIGLNPGVYQVSLSSEPAGVFILPQTITLQSNQYYTLNFRISPPGTSDDEGPLEIKTLPLPKS